MRERCQNCKLAASRLLEAVLGSPAFDPASTSIIGCEGWMSWAFFSPHHQPRVASTKKLFLFFFFPSLSLSLLA